jgi:hypothetical protein
MRQADMNWKLEDEYEEGESGVVLKMGAATIKGPWWDRWLDENRGGLLAERVDWKGQQGTVAPLLVVSFCDAAGRGNMVGHFALN